MSLNKSLVGHALDMATEKGYAEGYAAAIADTLKIVDEAFSKTGGGTMVTTMLTTKIKALLQKGTK